MKDNLSESTKRALEGDDLAQALEGLYISETAKIFSPALEENDLAQALEGLHVSETDYKLYLKRKKNLALALEKLKKDFPDDFNLNNNETHNRTK